MNDFPKTVHAGGVPYTLMLCGGGELLANQVAEIARLIHVCGAVRGNIEQIERRVQNAHLFVIAFWTDKIVGVAALKAPQLSYRKTLKQKTSVNLSTDEYPVELGYVAISKANRGHRLSSLLMAELMSQPAGTEGVFVTTKLDRFRKVALPKLGFDYRGSYRNDDSEIVYLLTKAAT